MPNILKTDIEALRSSGHFDEFAYGVRYQDVMLSGIEAATHYLWLGMRLGRDAGPLMPNESIGVRIETATTLPSVQKSATLPDLSPVSVDAAMRGTSSEGGSGFTSRTLPNQYISDKLRATILHSGLFDPEWYSSTYEVCAPPQTLLDNYLTLSERDSSREPGPLFSGQFYTAEHPDTVSVNPLVHFVEHGMSEGRRAFDPACADRFMRAPFAGNIRAAADYFNGSRSVVVLYWDAGNSFFEEIASYVAESLKASGLNVELLTDHQDTDLENTDLVVVAPHEYCVHGPGRFLGTEILERAVVVNTEQWHTSWFSLALDKMLKSKQVLDINPMSARGLAKLGMDAGFLPLLPKPGGVFDFRAGEMSRSVSKYRAMKPLTYPEIFAERTYEIMFAGALNDSRARKLATLAPTLSKYDCFLHAPRLVGPLAAGNANAISSRDLGKIAQNTKILLNVHQGDSQYFEWHRLLLLGIAQGCVPVTEPCLDIGIVEVGEHYIAVEVGEMPDRLSWLLDTGAGRQELQRIHEKGRVLIRKLGGVVK